MRILALSLLSLLLAPGAGAVSIQGIFVSPPTDVVGTATVTISPLAGNGAKISGTATPDAGCDLSEFCEVAFTMAIVNTLQGNILFQYDFNFTTSTPEGEPEWSLINLDNSSLILFGGPGQAAFSGQTTLISGNYRFSATAPNSFALNIPSTSWDFTPSAAGVPEPASVALTVTGLGLVAFGRLRRRR